MKKAAALLICIGGLLLISSSIIISMQTNINKKKEYKELKWDSYYGQTITSEYEIYKSSEYSTYNFNLNTNSNNTSFDIKLPKSIMISKFDKNSIEYTDNGIVFSVSKTYSENISKELEIVKENNDSSYDKVYIESTKYDDDIFAIIVEHAKYNEDKSMMMFGQEIRIYVKANEDKKYAIINLNAYEKRIDKETLSKIINSITIKKDTNNLCKKNKCQVELNKLHQTIKNNFTLDIKKDKYILEYNEGINGVSAYFVTKEYKDIELEEDSFKKLTSIKLELVYSDDSYIENLPNQEAIEVDGKKLISSYVEDKLEDIIQYKGTYIYQTNNNVSVIITIDSRLDNVEEVLKDFIKFKIN